MEFNFWQATTAGLLAELLDLLLLAAAIWLLLEHRADKDELRWLFAAAFVWGLGLTENWVMILLSPFFIAALVALRRLGFFQPGFLTLTTAMGLAGVLFFIVPPLGNWLVTGSNLSFPEAWHLAFGATRNLLTTLFQQLIVGHPWVAMLGVFYFLVPLLPCFIG